MPSVSIVTAGLVNVGGHSIDLGGFLCCRSGGELKCGFRMATFPLLFLAHNLVFILGSQEVTLLFHHLAFVKE